VVFLRKVRTASGATAVQIAERVGGRDKVIEHLGSAHTDAELAVLLETGRRKMHEGQGELDLVVGERDPREAIVRGQVSRVLIEVVEGAWRRLGFDVVGDAAFFQLVLARVVEPTSKADSVRVLTELGVTPVHRNTFTATLKRCGQRGYRDQIAAACFTYASTSRGCVAGAVRRDHVVLRGRAGGRLRKVGYSKERRVDPQIIVGLLVDRHGFPLEIGCWEGNKAETTTIVPIIRQFQERHSMSRTWWSSLTPGCCPRATSKTSTRPGAVHRRLPGHQGPN
jgi:hypothetical protein